MENVDERNDNYALEVNTMSLDLPQSNLADICQSYSERPLNTKHKSVSKIHPDPDRSQNYKKSKVPESEANIEYSIPNLMTTTNFSTVETLDQLNNASLLDLSFDLSPVIPITPCSPSPIIGAQQSKDRGDRECDVQHDMEIIEIPETENISLFHNENELVTI